MRITQQFSITLPNEMADAVRAKVEAQARPSICARHTTQREKRQAFAGGKYRIDEPLRGSRR